MRCIFLLSQLLLCSCTSYRQVYVTKIISNKEIHSADVKRLVENFSPNQKIEDLDPRLQSSCVSKIFNNSNMFFCTKKNVMYIFSVFKLKNECKTVLCFKKEMFNRGIDEQKLFEEHNRFLRDVMSAVEKNVNVEEELYDFSEFNDRVSELKSQI